MKERFWLNKETFLAIAEASGLDLSKRHGEELYTYLRGVLPGLKKVGELELADLEPSLPRLSAEEPKR